LTDANTPASQTPLLSVDSSFSQFQLPDDAEIQRTIDQLLGKAAAAGVAAAQVPFSHLQVFTSFCPFINFY
jgi:hypothetical protein